MKAEDVCNIGVTREDIAKLIRFGHRATLIDQVIRERKPDSEFQSYEQLRDAVEQPIHQINLEEIRKLQAQADRAFEEHREEILGSMTLRQRLKDWWQRL